jgi:hypothetical protein
VPDRLRLVKAPPNLREPLMDANAAFGPAFAEIVANQDWRAKAWILWHEDGEGPGGRAEISDYAESTNAISFRARVEHGPTCVLLSVVQDGGWSARDETGAKVPLFRANGPFFAAALMPGDHTVRLTYWPPGFLAGLWIGVGTAVALAVAFIVSRRSRTGAPVVP